MKGALLYMHRPKRHFKYKNSTSLTVNPTPMKMQIIPIVIYAQQRLRGNALPTEELLENKRCLEFKEENHTKSSRSVMIRKKKKSAIHIHQPEFMKLKGKPTLMLRSERVCLKGHYR